MYVVLVAIGSVLGVLALMAGIGALLPKAHTASRALQLKKGPAEVWAVLSDLDGFARWHPGVKRVERLPEVDGEPRWREHGSDAITFELVEAREPTKMVTRITDANLPFGGSWTYEIEPREEGSTLTITEHGEVYNPVFRFLSKFVFGHAATIDATLKALERELG